MVVESIRRTPITLLVGTWMIAVHVIDPALTKVSYLALSPWMHNGLKHLIQNLAVFLIVGLWTERRVKRLSYIGFVLFAAYLSIYIPIAFEFGGLSAGASGLTKALVAYVGLVLLGAFIERIETMEVDLLEIGKVGLHFGLLFVITGYFLVTIARFTYYIPRPDGMAVSAHFTGLVLGWLWFAYRLSDVEMLSSLRDTKGVFLSWK